MRESKIQSDIMCILSEHPKVAWSYTTSVGMVKRGNSRFRVGYPGMSDIIGQLRTGQTLAIEVKVPGKKPTTLQQDFIDTVNRFGGVAGWADSIESALAILEMEEGLC